MGAMGPGAKEVSRSRTAVERNRIARKIAGIQPAEIKRVFWFQLCTFLVQLVVAGVGTEGTRFMERKKGEVDKTLFSDDILAFGSFQVFR